MTMVTVGYGDVTAANGIEVLYSNVIMFFSSLVFAYSINSIGMILKNIQVN
jgi:cyclic nucleotide gated channel alpha 1